MFPPHGEGMWIWDLEKFSFALNVASYPIKNIDCEPFIGFYVTSISFPVIKRKWIATSHRADFWQPPNPKTPLSYGRTSALHSYQICHVSAFDWVVGSSWLAVRLVSSAQDCDPVLGGLLVFYNWFPSRCICLGGIVSKVLSVVTLMCALPMKKKKTTDSTTKWIFLRLSLKGK